MKPPFPASHTCTAELILIALNSQRPTTGVSLNRRKNILCTAIEDDPHPFWQPISVKNAAKKRVDVYHFRQSNPLDLELPR
jgi:hypothetical protein